MSGKECVAIASDRHFGIQMQVISTNFKRIFKVHDHCFVGLGGLATDVQTVSKKIEFHRNLYQLRENKNMSPPALSSWISKTLYSRRFGPYFVSPIIAGLVPPSQQSPSEPTPASSSDASSSSSSTTTTETQEKAEWKPFLCATDLIGAMSFAKDFAVCGTSENALYGMAESLWKPDMSPDELFEVISQCLLAAIDRDIFAGWGGVVYIIEKDKITKKKLKTRQD